MLALAVRPTNWPKQAAPPARDQAPGNPQLGTKEIGEKRNGLHFALCIDRLFKQQGRAIGRQNTLMNLGDLMHERNRTLDADKIAASFKFRHETL